MNTKKIAGVLLGSAIVFSALFTSVGAQTTSQADLQAQINSLLQTIAALQSQLGQTSGSSTTVGTTGGYTFTTNLQVGSKGTDVMNLQKVLNMDPATQVSTVGAGSPGNETSTFGPATKAAVIKFQNKYASDVLAPFGLTKGTGFVGSGTRAKLNALHGGSTTVGGGTVTTYPNGCTSSIGYSTTTGQPCSGGTTVVTVPSGSGLVVTMPAQPAPQLAPMNASRVPFTTITLTAGASDVTVNGINVQRAGQAVDAAFSGVILLDQNGIQSGIAKTFNSLHQATVGDPFTVKAGTSVTLTIAGNMETGTTAGGYAGQVAAISVTGINTSATVTGNLPITGTAQTINESLTIGTAQMAVSSFDPSSAQSKPVGTTAFRFAGVRITAGSAEQLKLTSIRWNQSGSVSASDLSNLVTVIDGVSYPTSVSTDGKYLISTFGSGIIIDKGLAKDVYIQGDIVGTGAANRTVEFDIYKSTDVALTGLTYGYGIIPTNPNGSTATTASTASEFIGAATSPGTPFFSGSLLTVTTGSATTIQKSATVQAQNIAVNVSNQVLGGFETNFQGEPVSVQRMVFHFSTSSTGTLTTSSYYLTSISLVDSNGAVVAGPVDAIVDSSTLGGTVYQQKVTFTDTVTFPVGTATYTLKGKVASGVANGATYTTYTDPTTDWTNITGQVTGNTISLTNSAFTMNTMTVKAANLTVSVSTNPPASTIVPGGTVTFANYQLDASQSGEDLRISTFPTTLTVGMATEESKLSACQLYDGTTVLNTGSNVKNPVASTAAYNFTLDNSLIIPKNTVKTITLKCNVSSGTTAGALHTFKWGITNTQITSTLTATGVTSSAAVTATNSASGSANQLGQAFTVGAGSLAVSADASSPSYTIASAGSTGVIAGVIKFRAANQQVNLTKVGLILTNTASSSSQDLISVSLWNGSTQVGTATFTGSNTTATSTLSSSVLLPQDTDLTLTVKADLAQIGVSQSGTEGHLIAIDYNSAQGTGVQSGTTVEGSGSTAFAGIRLFKSFPTFALDTLPSNGVADGRLLRVKISADAAGPISIAKFVVALATTSATVSSVNAFGFTDSGYSQPISGINTGGQFMTAAQTPPAGSVASPQYVILAPQTTAGATTTIQIPAGATRYFEIRGTVAGSGTTYSVTTTLKGDSSYPAAPPLLVECSGAAGSPCGITASGISSSSAQSFVASSTPFLSNGTGLTYNFVWSPNATSSSSALTDTDWTTGYGIPGLPGNGLIQSRTN